MRQATCTIGIDIGTTSTKAVLYDEDFQIISHSTRKYPTIRLEKEMAEQNPDEIFEAVLYTIKQLTTETTFLSYQIEHISFSSAMHSVILLDKKTNC